MSKTSENNEHRVREINVVDGERFMVKRIHGIDKFLARNEIQVY